MFVDVQRLDDRDVDCERPIHGGTIAPAPADVLVDEHPLCLHHHLTDLPTAAPACVPTEVRVG